MSTACPPSTDSPLSTTSSVLSILTFGLGLLGFYLALISSTRSAPREIQRLVSDLRSTQAEINRVSNWIFDSDEGSTWGSDGTGNNNKIVVGNGRAVVAENRGRDARYPPPMVNVSGNYMLYEEVQGLLVTCIRLFYEADDLLKRSEREGKGLWRRVLFLVNRDEVLEKVSRLQEQKSRLAAIQMSLFLRKSTEHDTMLKRVVRFIDDFEARDRNNDTQWFESNNRDRRANSNGGGGGGERSILTDSSYVRYGQPEDNYV